MAQPLSDRVQIPMWTALVEILAMLALVPGLGALWGLRAAGLLVALAVYLCMAALILRGLPRPSRGLGWANRVTLLRGALVCTVAGSVVEPPASAGTQWLIAGVALFVLALDGVDGWVARRNGETSAFGARFDMELDAFLILVLCAWLIAVGKVGIWVLVIGIMRYVFVMAGFRWRYLAAPLPESRRRKAVCVWQVGALLVAMLPIVGEVEAAILAASALAVSSVSFGVDVLWLRQHSLDFNPRSSPREE